MSTEGRTSGELRVVGLMGTLSTENTPRLLRAVFEIKANPGNFILPPYRWDDQGRLTGGLVESVAKFDALVTEGDATKLPSPIDCQPAHLLWADDRSDVRYAPASEVRSYLLEKMRSFVKRAQAALEAGDPHQALTLAQAALCADERSINALVIASKAHQRLANEAGLAILRSVARSHHPTLDLDGLLRTTSIPPAAPGAAPALPPERYAALFDVADRPKDKELARVAPVFSPAGQEALQVA
ncbi:MAG: hypothetical protein HZA54_20495 [Planctomycetes bacterium]|nr:hypothetical protein [Planctomycetota bacterium]